MNVCNNVSVKKASDNKLSKLTRGFQYLFDFASSVYFHNQPTKLYTTGPLYNFFKQNVLLNLLRLRLKR